MATTISASDAQALQNYYNAIGQYNWSDLLGQVTLGTPAPGTPTLKAGEDIGTVLGQPTTTEQALQGVALNGQNTVAEQTLAGLLPSGADTLARSEATGFFQPAATPLMSGAPTPDNPAVQALAKQFAMQGNATLPVPLGGLPQAIADFAGQNGVLPNSTGMLQDWINRTTNGTGHWNATGNIQGYQAPQPTPTVAEQQLQANTGLDVLKLIAAQRGPANAFTQQAVLHGLGPTGLSNAVGAIQGKYGLPVFSAPNANPQAASIQTLMDQAGSGGGWTGAGASYSALKPGAGSGSVPGGGAVLDASQGADGSFSVNPSDGGTTVFGGTHLHMNGAGGASTLDPTTAAYVNALPAPNKINGPNWETLDDSTKQFLLGAYQAAGYDPADVLSQVSGGLPQFKAPSLGSVGSSGQLVG